MLFSDRLWMIQCRQHLNYLEKPDVGREYRNCFYEKNEKAKCINDTLGEECGEDIAFLHCQLEIDANDFMGVGLPSNQCYDFFGNYTFKYDSEENSTSLDTTNTGSLHENYVLTIMIICILYIAF